MCMSSRLRRIHRGAGLIECVLFYEVKPAQSLFMSPLKPLFHTTGKFAGHCVCTDSLDSVQQIVGEI